MSNRLVKVGVEVKVCKHRIMLGGVGATEPSYYAVVKERVKDGVWLVLDDRLRFRTVLEEWLEVKRKPTGRLRGTRGVKPIKRCGRKR